MKKNVNKVVVALLLAILVIPSFPARANSDSIILGILESNMTPKQKCGAFVALAGTLGLLLSAGTAASNMDLGPGFFESKEAAKARVQEARDKKLPYVYLSGGVLITGLALMAFGGRHGQSISEPGKVVTKIRFINVPMGTRISINKDGGTYESETASFELNDSDLQMKSVIVKVEFPKEISSGFEMPLSYTPGTGGEFNFAEFNPTTPRTGDIF